MTTTLYAVIADIREASGLGVKPMLSELAPEIGKMRAEIERLQERCEAYKGQVESGAMMIERLRAALTECAAPFRSRPCTMAEAPEIVGHEFQRRMDLAAAALGLVEQNVQPNEPQE